MQQIQSCNAARQRTIKIDVGWIQHVLSSHHRRDGECALIDGVEHRVGVAVDDAGHDVLASAIDDARARRSVEVLSDAGDLAVANQARRCS